MLGWVPSEVSLRLKPTRNREEMLGLCVNLRLFPPSQARGSEKWSANPPIVKRPHSPLRQSSDNPVVILRTGS